MGTRAAACATGCHREKNSSPPETGDETLIPFECLRPKSLSLPPSGRFDFGASEIKWSPASTKYLCELCMDIQKNYALDGVFAHRHTVARKLNQPFNKSANELHRLRGSLSRVERINHEGDQ